MQCRNFIKGQFYSMEHMLLHSCAESSVLTFLLFYVFNLFLMPSDSREEVS